MGARLVAALRRPSAPPSLPWETLCRDPAIGPVRLTGALSERPGAVGMALLVHGLGGSSESPYLRTAAAAAAAAGLSALRLNLRGSDRRGGDYFHAGLTDDLRAALASPAVAAAPRVVLLGYSLGGHLALRYLTEDDVDPRVVAAAAVCAPLDLDAGARAIDAPGRWLYRRYLLRHLEEIYAEVARTRPVPVPPARVRQVRRLREFDGLVIAPRFGFRDAEDYYARMSVGPRLGRLARPALLVAARHDPMVPAATLAPSLAAAPPRLTVRWTERGGHVGLPADLDLGLGPGTARGVASQAIGWLMERLGPVALHGEGDGGRESGR